MIIQDRLRLIRSTVPNIAEELFEMSNRICDLCGHEIQDLTLAALDHSVPVICFARALEINIADAVRECNDPSNLRIAHASCNAAKGGLTREEWFAYGLNERNAPRIYSDDQLQALRLRHSAQARVAGRNGNREGKARGGRSAVINKTGIFAPDYDRRTSGCMSVETRDRLARIRTPEHQRIAARAGGRAAVRSGQIKSLLHIRWHVSRGISNPSCSLC